MNKLKEHGKKIALRRKLYEWIEEIGLTTKTNLDHFHCNTDHSLMFEI